MRRLDRFLVLGLGMAVAGLACAQFKWVGPDGKVNYSDLPPPPGTATQTLGGPVRSSDTSAESTQLPPSLKEVVSKYPVVLYTTQDCGPCREAHAHLTRRGVPFSERTVGTTQDAELFRKAGFTDNRFPALTVGRERQVGFEPDGWGRLLDAAGYPKTSKLPPNWRPASAEPLAPLPRPAPGIASDEAVRAEAEALKPRVRSEALPPATQGSVRPPSAPGSIRF